MIRDQWYPVLETSEIKKKNQLIGAKRLGEKLAFWRDSNGEVHCIFDRCAHRGASLCAGQIVNDNVQCPFHGLEYDKDGKCVAIPSRGANTAVPKNFKVHSYLVKEAHDFIWIWWGEPREDGNYPSLPWFEDLDDDFHYITCKDPWKCHYSRCIENQLDVTHLWLVHKNTIGRGNKRVSDGPYVIFDDDENKEKVWVFNRKDDGTPSLLPKEVEKPDYGAMLHFKFPNIWQNRIADKVRIFIAFVPVDEENTILYIRFCHKITKVPVLRGFISRMGRFGSKIIAHQDRRVVETQEPKRTELKMDENLFPADAPIVIYRRLRDTLKKSE